MVFGIVDQVDPTEGRRVGHRRRIEIHEQGTIPARKRRSTRGVADVSVFIGNSAGKAGGGAGGGRAGDERLARPIRRVEYAVSQDEGLGRGRKSYGSGQNRQGNGPNADGSPMVNAHGISPIQGGEKSPALISTTDSHRLIWA